MTYTDILSMHPKYYWKYRDTHNHVTIDRTLNLEISSETLNYLEEHDYNKDITIKAYCYEYSRERKKYLKNNAKTRVLVNGRLIYDD